MVLRRIGLLQVILASALPGENAITKVDFKNFVYLWDVSRVAVPSVWEWLSGKPASNLRVAEGRHDFDISERLAGPYLMVHSVMYGDLDNDGRPEATVNLLYGTGGTANWHYLYVFKLVNGLPTLLARLRSGSRADGGLLKVQIAENSLILDFANSNRATADCCSDGFVRVTYRWQSGRFVEVGTRIFGDLDATKQ